MSSALQRVRALGVAQAPVVIRARHRLRERRDAADELAVRQARGLARALRTAPPDVVAFGESVAIWTGPDDVDQRDLPTMVADALGPGVSYHPIVGAGFNPRLYTAYLRLIAASGHRPAVVVPLWVRGALTPWLEHPVYAHREAVAAITALDPAGPLRRMRMRTPQPDAEAFARFGRLPLTTLLGPGVIADYMDALRDGARWAEDDPARVRHLYAYHHGGDVADDGRGVEAVRTMAKALGELRTTVVAYETPLSVATGSELLGDAFAPLVQHNFDALAAAYRDGMGDDATLVRCGTDFAPAEFIDPLDGSEHLNEHGRTRLAALLAAAITAGREHRPLSAAGGR